MRVMMIFEVLGRPAEFVDEVIKEVVKKLGEEKGVTLINKKIANPKVVETMFSTFAEVEIEINTFKRLLDIVFGYMPANVEIVSGKPELTLQEANEVVSDLTAKLHRYDAATKQAMMERDVALNKVRQIEPDFNTVPVIQIADKRGEKQIKKKKKTKKK